MPHIVIEYSADIGILPMDMVKKAHAAAISSGLFNIGDIKTRAYAANDYVVGEGNRQFIHVTLYLLEGRTVAQKQQLSQTLSEALLPAMQQGQQLSVDIRDLIKDIYRKHVA